SDCVATALGKLTLPPDSIIAELVIMKMIKRTKKMSVKGVILISAMISEPFSLPLSGVIAIRITSRAHVLENLCNLNAEKTVEGRDPRLKIIVKYDCDDGHCKSKSGSHKGFRNAGGNHRKSSGARYRHTLESFDNTDDGAQ